MNLRRNARTLKLISQINAGYPSGSVIGRLKDLGNLKIPRFSSQSIELDIALGGGWPFGRILLIAGEFSTGKTALALKACGSIKEYDVTTRRPIRLLDDPKQGEKCKTLFMDFEGTFDEAWAELHGFDREYDLLCRPEYSEQGIDVVDAAIREDVVDLIIIDSVAAMTPIKETEASAEEQQMGLAARVNNKAFRRWNISLNKIFQQTKRVGPTIMVLNQLRLKIGPGAMFGDPRTLPGGKGQEFVSSIIVYTKSQKYSDKTEEYASVELGGSVRKNKTFPPQKVYKFDMALKDIEGMKKGDIDNAKSLLDRAKKYGLVKLNKGEVSFGTRAFGSQKDLLAQLKVSEKLQRSMWRSVVKAGTDYMD